MGRKTRFSGKDKQRILRYINQIQARSDQPLAWVLQHLDLSRNTYYRWRQRAARGELDDKPSFQLNLEAALPEEIDAVIRYALEHPADGYRRLAWMMIDEDIAYLSPSSVYRILSDKDLLYRYKRSQRSSGRYDFKPTAAHQQWHTDILYLWVKNRWYFFVGILDAFSRYIVHWELLESMSGADVRAVLQSALKKYPGVRPRLVSDNGVQFKGDDFKALIKEFQLKEIKIRIAHPESNGAIERFHRSLREEAIGEDIPQNKYDAIDTIASWVTYYNEQRLHAGLLYLKPVNFLNGEQDKLLAIRRKKLIKAARIRRNKNRESYSERNDKEQINAGALPPHPQDLSL
ncbi:MAG: IS3 family transposase [Deferribacteres bacterium]|nr:IS3 family transposase [Deferribacteres bacterium]